MGYMPYISYKIFHLYVKVSGPRVQTFCIENGSYMDAI